MTTETNLLNAVLDYCAYHKICAVHHRTTGALIVKDGNRFFGRTRFDQRGGADVILAYKGRAIALELKSPGKYQRPDQKEWEERWKRQPSEGIYAVIRSLDELESLLSSVDQRLTNPLPISR